MEYLDIVDNNGQPTGQTVEREKAHAEGIMHRTSHLWLAKKTDDRIQVLIQKRSDIKDSFPGCFDISSAGHIPAGVDFAPSAVRELKEELGVDASVCDLIVCGDRRIISDEVFRGKPFHDRQYTRVFFMWFKGDDKDFILQEEEVSSVKWVNIDRLIKAVNDNTIKHCIYPDELMMVKKKIEEML